MGDIANTSPQRKQGTRHEGIPLLALRADITRTLVPRLLPGNQMVAFAEKCQKKRSILQADYFLASTTMNDYAIGRCSRRCRVLDRPLEPGERFYSVAVTKGGEIVRYDVSESEWKGPPTEAIGWWRGTMDPPKPQRIVPTPNSELVEKLGQLCNDPNQRSLAHLLGLLLVRRKVLQPELDDSSATDESPTHQCLVHPMTEQKFTVPIEEPELASLKDVQDALQALLYTEG